MANLRSVDGTDGREPLGSGTRIVESASGREGVVLDHACQYAHPQAAPVFQYLVRWDDGQVEALSESALRGGHGLEVVRGDDAAP